VQELQTALNEFKAKVDSIEMSPSDRKKLLALPFFLAKRSQLPEPRRGQAEFDLFTRLSGMNWYQDSTTNIDQDYKITEFDYENYIAPQLIPKDASESKEFKNLIRAFNLFS
jgi:hypothetical protein